MNYITREYKSPVPKSSKLARTVTRKIQLGFYDEGCRELREMARAEGSVEDRLSAMWELACWSIETGTRTSLEEARSILLSMDDCAVQWFPWSNWYAMLTECCIRLGHRRTAVHMMIDEMKKDKVCINTMFVFSNVINSCLAASDKKDNQYPVNLLWWNKILRSTNLEPCHIDNGREATIDNLEVYIREKSREIEDPLVSIIMPVYKAQETIMTALRSLLNQTWRRIEVIVVDDASDDDTVSIAKKAEKTDARIRVVALTENSGPYNARNVGMACAVGKYVTTHDSDDWSHPRKIECQANHLEENPDIIANRSSHVRATTELIFSRRGNKGFYMFPNMSSLMFRRRCVVRDLGYWDEVRFGADGELLERIVAYYGRRAVEALDTGPLSILRVHAESLTSQPKIGYPGYKVGVRQEYDESFREWHRAIRAGRTPYLEAEPTSRRFAVPVAMEKTDLTKYGSVDVIYVGDFRGESERIERAVKDIGEYQARGKIIGILSTPRYDGSPYREMDARVRRLVDGQTVRVITWGEKVSADVVWIHDPWLVRCMSRCVPEVQAKKVIVSVPKGMEVEDAWYVTGGYRRNQLSESIRDKFSVTPVWKFEDMDVKREVNEWLSGEARVK